MAADEKTGMDQQAHLSSYSRFLTMVKWGTVVSAIVVLFVVLIIS